MIEQSTFDFLRKLKKNNNREWFEKNKAHYLAAKENVEAVTNKIIEGLRSFDKRIAADLTAKDCVFRIYRDTRFAKDKKPYKTNMGASMNPGGRKSMAAGYYLHVEPGECFLAGGMYMPEPVSLGKVRQEIDYNFDEFKKILGQAAFKKNFGGLWEEDDKLKTAPKGYAKDHPALEHLQHKHFIAVCDLKDADLTSKNFVKNATAIYKTLLPLNLFLTRATD